MALVPKADYDRLLEAAEDAFDLAGARDIERAIASGEDELIPAEFAHRLIDGENPIRVWREFRGLSGKDLAEQASVSAPYLSQIETGQRDGTFETMKRIAEALRVKLDDLA